MRPHLFRISVLLALLSIGALTRLSAQEPVGLHITSLTSSERDSITQEMMAHSDLKVIYACIPAGVIVFGTDQQGTSVATLRSQVVEALTPLVGAGRVADGTITLHAAEMACETARDQ